MQALRRSWLGKLAGSLSTPEQAVNLADADLAFLNGLFEQYVDTGLALVRSKCHEVIPTVDINLVTSLTYLLQASLCLAAHLSALLPCLILIPAPAPAAGSRYYIVTCIFTPLPFFSSRSLRSRVT